MEPDNSNPKHVVLPAPKWADLSSEQRSEIVRLLVQTAYEIVAAQGAAKTKEERNGCSKNQSDTGSEN